MGSTPPAAVAPGLGRVPWLVARPIGVVGAPYRSREAVPPHPHEVAERSLLTIFEPFAPALGGLAPGDDLFVIWWGHEADRTCLARDSGTDRGVLGVFASRVPDRPNPIALSRARITDLAGNTVVVTGLDALDGSPIIDLKPVVNLTDGRPA